MKNLKNPILTALAFLALVPLLATSAAADDCHDDPCQPELVITGATIDGEWWGTPEDIHVGWTVVDLVIPEGCECKLESWNMTWHTFRDHHPVGHSAGVEVTQADEDTWVFHNFDADLYYITFTVYVYCADGSSYPVSVSWYQLN